LTKAEILWPSTVYLRYKAYQLRQTFLKLHNVKKKQKKDYGQAFRECAVK